jgi:2-amino-4-hydroxy-6-hydroxymethyldihydropteridine diphosphokinase
MDMMHRIFLGLGTNLGARLDNLKAAAVALAPGVLVTRASPIFETEPWGFTDQPAFLNQALEGQTKFSPLKLLAYLKNLEKELGRTPSFVYGPRVIDIDLLFYDELVLKTDNLEIPHPQVVERAFVLVPLSSLAPDLRHPVLGLTMLELLANVDTHGVALHADGEGNPIQ